MVNKISDIVAREILDCRSVPTVEVDVWVNGDLHGRADVPAGRSTGKREAVELRDGGDKWRGMSVTKAVQNVNEILGPALIGLDVREQRAIDDIMRELDGTQDKSHLGANAIVGVSLAVTKAAASVSNRPLYKYLNPNAHVLPVPLINLINGGKLTSNDLEFQEFLVMPVGAESFWEALQICYDINHILRGLLVDKYGKIAVNVGDEGGFAPPMRGIQEPMQTLSRAVQSSGHAKDILYAFDAAASHWYDWKEGVYILEGEKLSRDEVIEMYVQLCNDYPVGSIEDPLWEEDWEGYRILTEKLTGVQIVGDDLFTTNKEYIHKGVQLGAANAVLWKFNQVGTISEALDAAEYAYRCGYGIQVSERSGETEDTSIADFVVALNAGQIKTGTTRSERTAKYNQLIRIAEELGNRALYAGRNFHRP
jgi:enolase